MSIDPFIGVLIGLAAGVAIGVCGAWFAGVFDRTPEKEKPVAAE